MPAKPEPRTAEGGRRWIFIGGGLLALLAATLTLLPILLLSDLEPVLLPPLPEARTAAARDGSTGDASSGDSNSSDSNAGDSALTSVSGRASAANGESGTRPGQPAEGSVDSESAAGATDRQPPIIERRRVQGGQTLPGSAETRKADRPLRRSLDRSADARRRRTRQFGGTANTEGAVEAGLNWLAVHQSPDGSWDRIGFQRQCPRHDECPGRARNRSKNSLKPGVTGLALLAFLGAGYSDRQGPHQDTVAKAVAALLAMQRPDGGFSADTGMAGYNDSVATFALAEYLSLTRERRVEPALGAAVQRLVAMQQELGGWDYGPERSSGRNDSSITAWMVQALQACAVAGVIVPADTFIRAALHFTRASEPGGKVWYADAGTGFTISTQTLRPVYRYGPAMTAAGLTSESLLGWRSDSPLRLAQKTRLFAQLPSGGLAQGRDPSQLHSYYYWYYGTIAMFQTGGRDWQRWNAGLRDALLPLQSRDKTAKGEKRHRFGSWPPFGPGWGKWGRMGGRVYTTAICTLTLEIYYRHTPAYLDDRLVVRADDWRSFLERAGARSRRLAVDSLREMRVEVGEPPLVQLLSDADRDIALAAAEALVAIDSPMGRSVMEQRVSTLPAWARASVERSLGRARAIEQLRPSRGMLRLFDAEHRLATLDLPRAYLGMKVTVLRTEHPIAQMRVIQRFTGRTVVLAELIGDASEAPRHGDPVVES